LTLKGRGGSRLQKALEEKLSKVGSLQITNFVKGTNFAHHLDSKESGLGST